VTKIGVLGEDATDCRALRVILQRILPKGVGVKTQAPPSGGCSALRRKAASYMQALRDAGCSAIVLVHDLDQDPERSQPKNVHEVRAQLQRIPVPAGIDCLICIPMEELEAWFWADQATLDRIAKGHGKASTAPHTIRDPKGELRRLSARAHGKKPVYSTNMNEELAKDLDLEVCAERCEAFRELRSFALQACGAS
jgi:Domain of unknown function (DUF4276)